MGLIMAALVVAEECIVWTARRLEEEVGSSGPLDLGPPFHQAPSPYLSRKYAIISITNSMTNF
eukprot:2962499-Pyramimonas_sp.AAC.1